MMKFVSRSLVSGLVFFSALALRAQTPEWIWSHDGGSAAHAQGPAAVRDRRNAAVVHRRDGQHHPRQRAPDHRPRLERHPQPALADYGLFPRFNRLHAALRQDYGQRQSARDADDDHDCGRESQEAGVAKKAP